VIDATSFDLRVEFGAITEVGTTGPDDEATIAFFARVRQFGTRGTDTYVLKFIEMLAAEATGSRAVVVEHLREAHADLGVVSHEWHKHVLGEDATPRKVWELWTYAHILHPDPLKREQWAALSEPLREMAKYVAYAYAGDLYHLVTVVEAMLRDPKVDDRQVNMQYLAPRPDFPVPDHLKDFKAAKVRLHRKAPPRSPAV
jgi:hypothetical protein